MSENQLIGIIYSQLIEEFGFGYSEKDLWMIAENIAGKIESQQPELDDNQKIILDWLKDRFIRYTESIATVIYFLSNQYPYSFDDHGKAKQAFKKLTRKQQLEVLSAFTEWALAQEDNDDGNKS